MSVSVQRNILFIGLTILAGMVGAFELLLIFISQIVSLTNLEFSVTYFRFVIIALSRLTLAGLFVWQVKKHKASNQFYFNLQCERVDYHVIGLIAGLCIILAYFNALALLDHISWMPFKDYPSTILSALFFSFVEEIEYRVVLLSFLIIGLRPYFQENADRIAIVLVIILFGPVHHIRYYFRAQYFTWAIIILLSIIWTIYVGKRKRILPTMFLHAWVNFWIFVFIGGEITTL